MAGFTVMGGSGGNRIVEAAIGNNLIRLLSFFLFLFLFLIRTKITFRYFREVNVSIKSADFISVSWRPRGHRPGSLPSNPALILVLLLFPKKKNRILYVQKVLEHFKNKSMAKLSSE